MARVRARLRPPWSNDFSRRISCAGGLARTKPAARFNRVPGACLGRRGTALRGAISCPPPGRTARKEIEAGGAELDWRRCESEGAERTSLPGCRKLSVPLRQEGASSAPYGFVFRLTQNEGDRLSWNMIAFGEAPSRQPGYPHRVPACPKASARPLSR